MTKKPTYEELEQRVKDLEKESLDRNQAEQVLESERDKLKTLLDGLASTNIGVDIVSTDFEVLQQNQTLTDRFGDIVGKKCYKEYMALEEPCSFCPMVKALEDNRSERAELRGADGKDYEILAAPLTNQDGTVDKAIEVIQDITDRKRAGKELLFKENIITSSSSAIATCDLDGNMTYGNPSFLKAWGFDDAKEFLGKPFWEFWVVEDILDEIMQALRSEGKWLGETKAKRKDGTLFDVQISSAMVYDIEGNPVALTSTSIDITERKQAEEALWDSEKKYQDLYDNAPDMFCSVDATTVTILQCNQTLAKNLRYTKEEIVGRPIFDLYAPNSVEYAKSTVFPLFVKTGSIKGEELQLQRKDGSTVDVSLNVSAVRDEKGNILRSRSVWRDITKRKQIEKERERLIRNLKEALKEIKTLRGILPLCSFCKKIRDDKGYWEQVDVYIHKYSQADISHSICPDCAKEHYPNLDLFE